MDSRVKSVLRNYISKYGQGRNLEKFLRRNSYSSDERETSSITTCNLNNHKNKTKSMNSLTDLPPECNESAGAKPKSPVPDNAEPASDAPKDESVPMKSSAAKVVVKQSSEKVEKKSKNNFNYESIIEINFPTPFQNQLAPVALSKERVDEEPIKPVLTTPMKPKMPQNKRGSPRSSANDESSNKQNIEWDSYIPGYDDSTIQNFQLCNPMELDGKELDALKKYFQHKGLKLPAENLVLVIKNKDREDQQPEREKRLGAIRKNKEKWENIYEKYKEKYKQHSNLNFTEPDARSTPKIPEPGASKMNEKSSQTSLVKSQAKSIQVDDSSSLKTSNNANMMHRNQNRQISQEMYHEVADSFEFIAGPMKSDPRAPSSTSSANGTVVKEAPSQKDSSSSERSNSAKSKHEEVSDFDDSLKVAIALLNSLLESRHMKPELKRNLASKVIHKIVQLQTSRSIQTSTLGSSVYADSSPSSAPSKDARQEKESLQSSRKSQDEMIKDCLKPMTHSEVDYQNHHSKASSASSKKVPKSQIIDFAKREKASQLKWIEKEIDHLKNLRDLLRRNETPISMVDDPTYENLPSVSENDIPKFPVPSPEIVEDEIKAASDNAPNVPETNWNSHVGHKKVAKNRSKIKTPETSSCPTNEQSLASFISSRNQEFLEKYEKHQKVYEDVNIYTRPYSIHKGQDSKQLMSGQRKPSLAASKDVHTSTSLPSSVFESSDSISVPVANNTDSKTTTHYQSEDLRKNRKSENKERKQKQKVAGTQTTDSICRTNPIFENRSKANDPYGTISVGTTTQRINKTMNNKQQQTRRPPSVKYTLTFDNKSRVSIRKAYSSLPQQVTNEYATCKSSKDIYNQQMNSASLDARRTEDKENYCSENDGEELDIDLQRCLIQKRPGTFRRFEQRQQCIAELKKLRALRNEHRQKLLLLTSDKSLEGKLLTMPEIPMKKRIFTTKAIKMQTKKTVKNLAEVQRKKDMEVNKNLKRKNRLMTEIFNRNLQKNVLRGNLNLSNTVNLISK